MRQYLVSLRSIASLSLLISLAAACGPSGGSGDDDTDGGGGDCIDGARRCDGTSRQQCQDGAWTTVEECGSACDTELGCVLCVPGTGTCNGDTSTACRPDGQGYFEEYCDPLMGSTCNTNTGVCDGPCSANALGQSYIGCDYYPTQMSQLVNPSFQFGIAVSNTTGEAATVTIEDGALTAPITLTVPAGAVAVQVLPWVPALKRCMTETFYECGPPESYGALALNGAYHLRSTRPVTVYQFSPLDYQGGSPSSSGFSYSNDASLLLPTNAWTGNYVAAGWQAWNPGFAGIMPSTMAVTAYQDGTSVTVTTRTPTTGGDGAPSFVAGTPQTVTLNAGDVLQLMAQGGDLTGSTVTSDKAVQVMAGHHCTQVPIGFTACDHLEESMFPIEALSNEYLVTANVIPSTGQPRNQVIRVTAAEPNTTVSFDPASVSGPQTLANIGDFLEIPSTASDVYITADNKIVVSHYMVGQDAPPSAATGDPAMTLAVPTDQYRLDYQFHAPTNYESNYVNVTAPMGATVTVDGTPIDASQYTPVGASGFGVARIALSNAGNGSHSANSSDPFGITVYGFGQYTSFWYPGGLDLNVIPVD
jgi:hypothetical protein